MKVTVKFTRAAITRAAAVAAGLDPKAIGMKPGGRIHRDRKYEAANGRRVKHKSRVFD